MLQMKIFSIVLWGCLLGLTGCHSTDEIATNHAQPGPQLGHVIGTVVGAVPGQVIGGTVAAVEAIGDQIKAPYEYPTLQIIRKWETVTTLDGRTIQVAREYYVNDQGEIIGEVEENEKS